MYLTGLATARRTPAEVDAVIISTCTGYLCPGLTSYVSERLGLRSDVLALAKSAPGGWWWLSSFGAGFSCHGALLKVD